MKKLSTLLTRQNDPEFPIIGQNGYAGEQDGTIVLTSEVLYFTSRKAADEKYPNGIPDYLKTHWCSYRGGWELVLGCWSNEPEEKDGNPFCMN